MKLYKPLDQLYCLEWYGNLVVGELTEINDPTTARGIKFVWQCVALDDIPKAEFITQAKELIGYLPLFKKVHSDYLTETFLYFDTKEDALAFKLAFAASDKR